MTENGERLGDHEWLEVGIAILLAADCATVRNSGGALVYPKWLCSPFLNEPICRLAEKRPLFKPRFRIGRGQG